MLPALNARGQQPSFDDDTRHSSESRVSPGRAGRASQRGRKAKFVETTRLTHSSPSPLRRRPALTRGGDRRRRTDAWLDDPSLLRSPPSRPSARLALPVTVEYLPAVLTLRRRVARHATRGSRMPGLPVGDVHRSSSEGPPSGTEP